jgi:hypothetical protein
MEMDGTVGIGLRKAAEGFLPIYMLEREARQHRRAPR